MNLRDLPGDSGIGQIFPDAGGRAGSAGLYALFHQRAGKGGRFQAGVPCEHDWFTGENPTRSVYSLDAVWERPHRRAGAGALQAGDIMSLRLTEEEYAALMRRRALPCVPAKPSGVSVADMGGDSSHALRAAQNDTGEGLKKRSKYGNRRVVIDGIPFDSQHEANIYQELMLRVKAGELKCVCRQVKFDLPGGIVYVADFVTFAPDMSVEGVYDAKSEATKKNRVYINKKKQMKACWGIEIREV